MALCSCVSAPEYYYGGKNPSLDEVSIIRGVKEDQSAWLNGLTAVFSANVISISRQVSPDNYQIVVPYKTRWVGTPIHVLPGTYIARVVCKGGGFDITLDFPPIAAEAGHEYQLECSGSSAYNMRPVIKRLPIAGASTSATTPSS